MRGRQIFHVLIAVMLFVSAAVRPPGTMLTVVGDTLTMELCIGAQVETISVNLDPSEDRKVDISCDVFTTPIATLPALSGNAGVFVAASTVSKHVPRSARVSTSRTWPPYTSRAPPLLS